MIENAQSSWRRLPPANELSLIKLVSASRTGWPSAYLELLRYTNGGEGALPVEPWWFQLWSAEDAQTLNEEYRVPDFCPEHWAFGSSGGGELFLLNDLESWHSCIYRIACIGMSVNGIRLVCNDMDKFIEYLGLPITKRG